MDNRAIGVFDSGLGGLTAVKELHRLLPNEDIIYLGDTGRVPYGSRSRETIIKYAAAGHRLFADQGHQAGSCRLRHGQQHPAKGNFQQAAGALCRHRAAGGAAGLRAHLGRRIGVVGTNATLRSNAFGKAIRSIRADVRVFGNPCPLLVHLVENGMVQPDNQITNLTVQMYLEPLMREKIDTLFWAAPHYPLLYDIFNRLLGYQVTLIDPGRCAAGYVQRYLMQHDLLADRQREGVTEYNVTDETDSFGKTASIFLGQEVAGTVNRVELVE